MQPPESLLADFAAALTHRKNMGFDVLEGFLVSNNPFHVLFKAEVDYK